MKKLLIPLVALLALAACSKVVPTAVEAGEQEVIFEVANYAAGTKANVSLTEEFGSFYTYAIFHSTDTANPNQWFFEDEEIISQGENGSISKWAPAGPRFWPKTGDISFYSYAGTRHPSQWPEPGKEDDASRIMSFGVDVNAGQEVTPGQTADGTGRTDNEQAGFEPLIIRGIPEVPMNVVEVDPTTNTGADAGQVVRPDNNGAYPAGTEFLPADNILVADPAFKFQKNLDDSYKVDNVPNGVAPGVPTLFHHMLAKVRFQLVLDARDSDPDTWWTLSLPEQQNLLFVRNQGSLVVTYSALPGEKEFNKTGSIASALWTVGEQYEVPIEARALTLEAQGGKCEPASPENNLIWVPEIEGQSFVREFVVIPGQRFADYDFNFACTLSNVYKGGEKDEPGVTETLSITDKLMSEVFPVDKNAKWEMNHIYTYRITVKTNGEITFDPAVVDWIQDEIEPEY